MATDPFQLFHEWLAEARVSEPNDPEAMALATACSDGRPSVRIVLLKDHGPDGFVFYTNEQSAKGTQLATHPGAALLFHWKSLRRQVRVEGAVERVTGADADAYFASRARDSQLGAWASDQSRPLESRETFEQIGRASCRERVQRTVGAVAVKKKPAPAHHFYDTRRSAKAHELTT